MLVRRIAIGDQDVAALRAEVRRVLEPVLGANPFDALHADEEQEYAHLEFCNKEWASQAMDTLNKSGLFGKPCEAVPYDAALAREEKTKAEIKALFVGQLASSVDEATLRDLFSPHGELVQCKIMPSHGPGGGHRGFGFVEFSVRTLSPTARMTLSLHAFLSPGRTARAGSAP